MKFLDTFNKLTNNKFDYLRVKNVVVDEKNGEVTLTFLAPYDKYDEFLDDITKEYISVLVRQILNTGCIKTVFTKSYIDETVIKQYIRQYLYKNYFSMFGDLELDSIIVNIDNDKIKIEFELPEHYYQHCVMTRFQEKIATYLESCFCAEFNVSIKNTGRVIEQDEREIETIEFDFNKMYLPARVIRPAVGKVNIYTKARFIKDVTSPTKMTCIGGRVSNLKTLNTKEKGKRFYAFQLDDNTGKISCLYFPRAKTQKSVELIDKAIASCEDIVVTGEVKKDRQDESLLIIIEKISIAEIAYDQIDFEEEKPIIVKKDFERILPKPYVANEQLTLTDFVPDKVIGKTFVCFDTETTGLDMAECKMVEIGAVKIVDGEITEYINTLVDPLIKIPASASQVNHIYDDMVAGMPTADFVVGEFKAFCGEYPLIGHNISYDMSVLTKEAMPTKYRFNNKAIDTIALAKKLKLNTNNNKLGTLCKYFDINNDNAHRAFHDAAATAKLFIKLVAEYEKRGLEIDI